MTLVLPAFCGNHTQQTANPLFTAIGAGRNSSAMPCGFDGEPLDFESALLSDWPSLKDITDSDDGDFKSTAGEKNENRDPTKRKLPCDDDIAEDVEVKRLRTESPLTAATASSNRGSSPSPEADEKETQQQDDADIDDLLYIPRRRVSLLWSPRQRLKDERKKVLKMSVNKMRQIEDPELCLWKSVLINNTMKKLQHDIREEKQAKIRHHQQQQNDFFSDVDRWESSLTDTAISQRTTETSSSDSANTSSLDDAASKASTTEKSIVNNNDVDTSREEEEDVDSSKAQGLPSSSTPPPVNNDDDNSCDEIFGISEDFLRVTIPDRRASSPLPSAAVQERTCATAANVGGDNTSRIDFSALADESSSSTPFRTETDSNDCDMDTNAPASACDTNSSSSTCTRTKLRGGDSSSSSPSSSSSTSSPTTTSSLPTSSLPANSRNIERSLASSATTANHCATQFRTNHDCLSVGEAFSPRVPILDSVVYHSLLASLES